jgi:hypothetical protein
MIEWLRALLQIGMVCFFGLLIMGLIGLAWVMCCFAWQRIKEHVHRD